MLTEQRYEIILKLVNEKKSITAAELIEILETSESTVRRDITALHKAGKLIKVFGGAVALEQAVTAKEYTVAQKRDVNQSEKSRIAAYAVGLVTDEDFIFLDAGTTTALLAEAIPDNCRATFVTNAVAHAQHLAAKGIKVILVGGELKGTTEAIVGDLASHMLSVFHFTKGFFGTNGITRTAGFTTPDPQEASVKQTAMNNCKEVYVLADSSKFGQISSVTFGEFAQATILTESVPPRYSSCDNIKEV